jgi:hypothetical protein
MDLDAVMVVQTPLAMNVLSKKGYAGLQDFEMPFHQERGTAQGGVDSSFVFTAFLDILLCAIQSLSTDIDQFYISDIDGNLQPTSPIGYVDDLICTTSTFESLQATADLVSAFCMLFQLTLNTSKFRAFSIIWGNPNITFPSQLVIHTTGWITVSVDIQPDGLMEHLGVTWDMSLSNLTMFENTKAKLQSALAKVINSAASQHIKQTAIRVSLLSQLVYATKFAPWPLAWYQQLDTILQQAYRTISKNRHSFPTDLLYLPPSSLGLGFSQFSELVQQTKLSMFQRSTYGGNTQREYIMNTLTGRVLRQMGCQPARYGPYSLTVLPSSHRLTDDKHHSWWFSSLAEHLQLAGLSIQRDNMAVQALQSHIPRIRLLPHHNRTLTAKGVALPLEQCMEGDLPNVLKAMGMEWTIQHQVPSAPLPIRTGQVWHKLNLTTVTHTVVEIAGFTQQLMHYYPWSVDQLSSQGQPQRVTLHNSFNILRGAGSSQCMPTDTFFIDDHSVFSLVTLDSEKYIGVDHVAKCLAIRERLPLISQLADQHPTQHPWFHDIQSMISSHTVAEQSGSMLHHLLGTQQYSAKSVIVKQRHNEIPHALLITHALLHTPTLVTTQTIMDTTP